jgi:hypothetical protein
LNSGEFKKLPANDPIKNKVYKLENVLKNWNSIQPDSELIVVKPFLKISELPCVYGYNGYFKTLCGDIYKATGNYSSSSRYYFEALEYFNGTDDTLNSIKVSVIIQDSATCFPVH